MSICENQKQSFIMKKALDIFLLSCRAMFIGFLKFFHIPENIPPKRQYPICDAFQKDIKNFQSDFEKIKDDFEEAKQKFSV